MRIMFLFHWFISSLCDIIVRMVSCESTCISILLVWLHTWASLITLPWLSTVHSKTFTGQHGHKGPLTKTCKSSTTSLHYNVLTNRVLVLAAEKGERELLDLFLLSRQMFITLLKQRKLNQYPSTGFKMDVWSCLLVMKVITKLAWFHRHHEVN